jgi:glycosyltransferase involved in cell wall biosynthesis
MGHNELVSVIIPVYNEEKDVVKCIESLAKQSHKNFEIIIVDDGSTDKTLSIAKDTARKNKLILKTLRQNHQGPGKARNLGAKQAKGEILIFIDADMTFHRDYLKNLIKPILMDKEKKVLGTTHDYETAENIDNIWSRCWGKIRVENPNPDSARIFRAIRKNKFLELGGFDSKYGYADDQTLWFKYKIKPNIAKNTECYHKNPETLKQVYRQSRWIGASLYRDLFLLKLPVVNILIMGLAYVLSPLLLIVMVLYRMIKRKDYKLFFYYWPFIAARYFGTIKGIINRVFLNKNFR